MAEFGKGAELLELESVQRAIDESSVYVGNEIVRRLRDGARFCIAYMNRARPMESPLEAMFFAWFSAVESLEDHDIYRFELMPQADVQLDADTRYRFDFQILFGPQNLSNIAHWRGITPPKVVVELNGHDFHERTKEQVAYRNKRDRDLAADGWTVFHFSGSELYKSPIKCASEVLEFCRKRHDEFSLKAYTAPRSEVEKEQGL